jgi:hypothetical protein
MGPIGIKSAPTSAILPSSNGLSVMFLSGDDKIDKGDFSWGLESTLTKCSCHLYPTGQNKLHGQTHHQ